MLDDHSSGNLKKVCGFQSRPGKVGKFEWVCRVVTFDTYAIGTAVFICLCVTKVLVSENEQHFLSQESFNMA